MKILLVSANLETKPAPVYPLGVSRLATALRAHGQIVKIYDCLAQGLVELTRAVAYFNPDLIGVSLRNVDNTESAGTQNYLDGYLDVMARLRASSQAPVVLGGTAYSIFPEALLLALQAEFGICGPGEEVLTELAQALENGQPPETVPGLIIRSGDHALRTARRTGAAQVLPGVVRDPELADYYWSQGGSLNLQTQLGCRHACVYCTYPQLDGPGCRALPAEAAAEEIRRMVSDFDASHVFITDSVFNLDPEHAERFCQALIRMGRPATWTCFCEPGRHPGNLLKLMAQAGCTHIEFGTDALSDKVLAAYAKPFCTADILAWSRAAAAVDIHQAHFLILGGPGETMETLSETFRVSREMRPAVFFPYLGMRIFPNTPLYRLAVREGVLAAGDDLLAPRFYFSERTPESWLAVQVEAQARRDTRWVTPALWKQSEAVMPKLRARGKKGPLWEYLAH
ncbi:MAG: radical SAM protein [Candidatus Firestonebacteria bacterium]|nr:radical SAM protein [Candidatus Firestonebacteria bacterium]